MDDIDIREHCSTIVERVRTVWAQTLPLALLEARTFDSAPWLLAKEAAETLRECADDLDDLLMLTERAEARIVLDRWAGYLAWWADALVDGAHDVGTAPFAEAMLQVARDGSEATFEVLMCEQYGTPVLKILDLQGKATDPRRSVSELLA